MGTYNPLSMPAGSGSSTSPVFIPDNVINAVNNQVNNRFTTGQAYATDAYNKAKAILDSLLAYIQGLSLQDPAFVVDELNNTFSYTLPEPPDITWLESKDDIPPIVAQFQYTEVDYTYSDLWLYIKNRTYQQLVSGGSGLTESVEQAIFNRESERDSQAYNDAILKIQSEWAELNAPMPNGILAGAMNPVTIEYMNKRLDKSRTIAEESRKMEVAASQFYTEKGIAMEAIVVDAYNKKWDRVLTAATEEVKNTLAIYETYIKKFATYSDAYKASGVVYEAQARGIASIADAETKFFQTQIEEQTNKLTADMKEYELRLKKFEIISQLSVEGMKQSGAVASTMAAGSLAGLSAIASLSGGGSVQGVESHSVNISYGVSNQWGYSETYDATPIG